MGKESQCQGSCVCLAVLSTLQVQHTQLLLQTFSGLENTSLPFSEITLISTLCPCLPPGAGEKLPPGCRGAPLRQKVPTTPGTHAAPREQGAASPLHPCLVADVLLLLLESMGPLPVWGYP